MTHSERLRERMAEHKDTEQTYWVSSGDGTYIHFRLTWLQRVEPTGWDAQERTYFLLDDNRLYRRTDPAPPALPAPATPKPKKNSKKWRAMVRASKRQKMAGGNAEDVDDHVDGDENKITAQTSPDDGLGGGKWECVKMAEKM